MKNFLEKYIGEFKKTLLEKSTNNVKLANDIKECRKYYNKAVEYLNMYFEPKTHFLNKELPQLNLKNFVSEKKHSKDSILRHFSKIGLFKSVISDYLKLEYIENYLIPKISYQIFNENFSFENLCLSVRQKGDELKQDIKNSCDFNLERLILNDIRNTEIIDILIKNGNKVINGTCEITVFSTGYDESNRKCYKENAYSCFFEFLKENDKWKCKNYSFKKL